jgi:hypothetical protein
MTFKNLIVLLLSLSLMSCGGGGGSDTPKEPPPPATPPVVTLSTDSTSFDENSTIVITHSAKDYQGTTIESELICDIGTLDGNNYTSPNIIENTTATCTAMAIDSGNRSTTETLTLTINVLIYPPIISLSVDSASIDESSTIVITHSAKDYQDTTITSELSCDIGTLDGNNYTSPNIIDNTTATCTATAIDSDNRSTTETLTLTINVLIHPPVISLSVDSASIDESSTIVITHSAKDYQDTTITSELSCDIGTLDGNNYTAPSVATETSATCTATATDSGNRSTTETITFTINALTPVLALADDQTEVVAAQIIIIDIEYAELINESLSATLDGQPIQLAKLNDNQLVFLFPLISPDTHSLVTIIENKTVTFNFSSQSASVPWLDSSIYLNDYLQELNGSFDQLESLGSESLDIEMVNELKEFLNPDGLYFSSLSEQDKELIAHIIYQNVVPIMQSSLNKNSVQKSLNLQINYNSSDLDPSCAALGISALAIQRGTVAALLAVGLSGGTLSLPASAAVVIINIANYAVIWPAAEKACTRPYDYILGNYNLNDSNSIQKVKQPIQTSVNQTNKVLDFYSHIPKKLSTKLQYEIISGNEEYFQNIINSFNSLGVHVRTFFNYLEANPLPVIGEINVPNYLKNFFSESISFEDIRYENISPNNLSVSAITDAGVKGGDITNINDNNSFDLIFNIEDLEVPHIAFQFTVTDSGHDTPLSTVIDAEVTLNPPIAYSETFAAVIGEDMTARLQADFETGFEIKTQPQFGVLDISGAFSYPGGGLFTYTPNDTITEDTTDSFTFVATNGSTTNDGESNEATITVEITANPYTISVGNYRPSFKDGVSEQLSIVPNQSVTFYNSVTKIIGANLDGQPVVIKNNYNGDYNYWAYDLPSVEFSENDVHVGTYNFELYDVTKGRSISVPVDLTISNEIYRTVVGKTLTIDGSGFNMASLIFKSDGTYTIDGLEKGGYTFLRGGYDAYIVCESITYDQPILGVISTGGSTFEGQLPAYIKVYEDGTFHNAGSYACPENTNYDRIF